MRFVFNNFEEEGWEEILEFEEMQVILNLQGILVRDLLILVI